jgi:hypothetical protein
MSRYRWVRAVGGGSLLYDVGILADGTLHNPRNYPEADVRAAIAAVEAHRAARRRQGAIRAAETRRRRRELRVYAVVERLRLGHRYGPRGTCVVCAKGLSDAPSIARGIGPECWNDILGRLQQQEAGADAS